MKINKGFLFITVFLLSAYVLSACGGASNVVSDDQAAIKVNASLIAYTGTVESMSGNEWVVNGQTLTVDPAVIKDGPYQVGDTVKIEGNVNADGSFTVTRIEAPSAEDLMELPSLGNDDVNTNSNDAITSDNASNENSNEDVDNENSNDDTLNDNSANDNGTEDDGSNINGDDDGSDDDNGSITITNGSGGGEKDNSGRGGGDDDEGDDD